jgi:hypothetical protein
MVLGIEAALSQKEADDQDASMQKSQGGMSNLGGWR